MEKRRKSASLLPVGVFLVFYLGLGILFEYIMKIPMGFYNVPIVVAFLAALLVACLQNRKVGFDEKLEIMGRGIGDKNIITMLLIFLTAGTFVGVVGRSRECGVFYAIDHPGTVCGCRSVCGCMFCFNSNGNFGWDDHPSDSDCGGSFADIRFFPGTLRGIGDGRLHVRGQSFFHIRYNNCCLQRAGM